MIQLRANLSRQWWIPFVVVTDGSDIQPELAPDERFLPQPCPLYNTCWHWYSGSILLGHFGTGFRMSPPLLGIPPEANFVRPHFSLPVYSIGTPNDNVPRDSARSRSAPDFCEESLRSLFVFLARLLFVQRHIDVSLLSWWWVLSLLWEFSPALATRNWVICSDWRTFEDSW